MRLFKGLFGNLLLVLGLVFLISLVPAFIFSGADYTYTISSSQSFGFWVWFFPITVVSSVLLYVLLYIGVISLDVISCWRHGHIPKRVRQQAFETCNLGHQHATGKYVDTDSWFCDRCLRSLQPPAGAKIKLEGGSLNA